MVVRHRDNPNVQGFIKGTYGAAIGTILGACVLLGRIVIGDVLTALIHSPLWRSRSAWRSATQS